MIWKTVLTVVVVVLLLLLLRFLLLITSIKKYESFWATHNYYAEAEKGELLYIALGDSTAQGVGASHPTKGYVWIIKEKLEVATGKRVRLINLSKSGATIQDVLGRQLPKLDELEVSPDILTIEIGANDVVKAYDAAVFETEFTDLLARLPKGSFVSDLPWFGGRVKQTAMATEASQMMRQKIESSDMHLVKLEKATKSKQSLRMYSADAFHPSNYGYTVWAEAFWSSIKKTDSKLQY